jgi:hypothetical protein
MSNSSPPTSGKGPLRWLTQAWNALASFSLGVVLLILLIVLTLLGTFSQAKIGLYDTQKKYFDSVYFTEDFYGIPLVLPGVYLILGLLFFNMLAGGLIRIRKKPQTIGVIIAHFSILFLIVAGWVSFHWKKEGNMALLPGETSDVVQAYNDWQIEIREEGASQVHVIRDSLYADCSNGKSRTFYRSGLPFELRVSEYARNCDVVEEGHPQLPASATRLEHFAVMPINVDPKNEANRGGAVIEAIDANNRQTLTKAIIAGMQDGPGNPVRPPVVIKVGDKKYSVAMVRERWKVPYQIHLDKFTVELYEGTEKAKVYQSEITKKDDLGDEKHVVGMNEPLRHSGYTFFQASYGRVTEDSPYYTVFAVVKNPSDEWPTYACIVATLGLMLHFILKLRFFLNRNSKPKTVAA